MCFLDPKDELSVMEMMAKSLKPDGICIITNAHGEQVMPMKTMHRLFGNIKSERVGCCGYLTRYFCTQPHIITRKSEHLAIESPRQIIRTDQGNPDRYGGKILTPPPMFHA